MLRRQVLTAAFAAPAVAAVASSRAQAKAPATSPVQTRDGTSLFIRDWGEGRPVVFVASWALASPMWAYQVAHLSDRGMRCVAFDRRGHGRSGVPRGGYDMDTFADDLAAVVERMGVSDVALVGHSMGCAEILHYLDRHGSRRVGKVALLAPAAPYLVKTADNPYGAPRAYHDARMAEWAQDFPKWIDANKAPFFTPDTSPAMTDWLCDELRTTPAPVAIATFRALLAKDLRPALSRIDRPTLVIQGDKDASAPLDITGRRVAAGIRGAELKVYDGAPHGLFVTHMDQVNRDLEAFLGA
jgi:pimeloyl-ACP methyl ester carboxylesterase